jgi:hypothetical protein
MSHEQGDINALSGDPSLSPLVVSDEIISLKDFVEKYSRNTICRLPTLEEAEFIRDEYASELARKRTLLAPVLHSCRRRRDLCLFYNDIVFQKGIFHLVYTAYCT